VVVVVVIVVVGVIRHKTLQVIIYQLILLLDTKDFITRPSSLVKSNKGIFFTITTVSTSGIPGFFVLKVFLRICVAFVILSALLLLENAFLFPVELLGGRAGDFLDRGVDDVAIVHLVLFLRFDVVLLVVFVPVPEMVVEGAVEEGVLPVMHLLLHLNREEMGASSSIILQWKRL
jgi:hypothetical protein